MLPDQQRLVARYRYVIVFRTVLWITALAVAGIADYHMAMAASVNEQPVATLTRWCR